VKRLVYWLLSPLVRWINRYHARRTKIDINGKCPACGHYRGKLEMVVAGISAGAGEPHIQHTCEVCNAKWFEATILKPSHWWKDPRVK
jgi:hypothetical protein